GGGRAEDAGCGGKDAASSAKRPRRLSEKMVAARDCAAALVADRPKKGAKFCKAPGCSLHCSFGFPDGPCRRRDFCRGHALPGMVNLANEASRRARGMAPPPWAQRGEGGPAEGKGKTPKQELSSRGGSVGGGGGGGGTGGGNGAKVLGKKRGRSTETPLPSPLPSPASRAGVPTGKGKGKGTGKGTGKVGVGVEGKAEGKVKVKSEGSGKGKGKRRATATAPVSAAAAA
ncbi:unnamed protein product, partial [Scytosiphon promiscuus]